MKRKFFIAMMLVMLSIPAMNLAAQNSGSPIGLDFGGVVSTGYIASEPYSFLFLLRGGATVTGRYRINETFSTGLELGFTYFSWDYYGTTTNWIDIPMNAVFRIGGGKTFVEPHVGYYLSASIMDFSGFSVGVKGSLGGFYTDITYVIGSDYKYPRFGIGWQYNNIF
ncbi:hypothetical protein [Spirochaeta isovalerica]|uniref:Outer membrane protein beta-barrel domain-containing protein n=1 Tax=Spirochaeta isovalerica TaxID=150 RepID=A0A841RBL4_9SPIO|nr:hypothetical protein [Spirochaeta isovalerica]MBB6480068.1 hypothetical protein [Spirochaeta isovalerica]